MSAREHRVSAALAAPVEELHEAVTHETIAHAEETSWNTEGKKAWVWPLAVHWAANFVVAANRNTAVAIKVLRSFAGILILDRWVAYLVVPGASADVLGALDPPLGRVLRLRAPDHGCARRRDEGADRDDVHAMASGARGHSAARSFARRLSRFAPRSSGSSNT